MKKAIKLSLYRLQHVKGTNPEVRQIQQSLIPHPLRKAPPTVQ